MTRIDDYHFCRIKPRRASILPGRKLLVSFLEHGWCRLSLCNRLSDSLFSYFRKALLGLENELNGMLLKTLKELEILGRCCDSLTSQRIFLTDLATLTSNIV